MWHRLICQLVTPSVPPCLRRCQTRSTFSKNHFFKAFTYLTGSQDAQAGGAAEGGAGSPRSRGPGGGSIPGHWGTPGAEGRCSPTEAPPGGPHSSFRVQAVVLAAAPGHYCIKRHVPVSVTAPASLRPGRPGQGSPLRTTSSLAGYRPQGWVRL